MDRQTQLQIKVEKQIDLTDEEMDSLKYLIEEFKQWRQLKNTKQ